MKTLLDVTKVSDCNTPDELAVRIGEYIALRLDTSGIPTKLGTLNRKFGVKAGRLNTSVRDLTSKLVERGELFVYEHKGGTVFLSEKFERVARENEPLEAAEMIKSFISRAE